MVQLGARRRLTRMGEPSEQMETKKFSTESSSFPRLLQESCGLDYEDPSLVIAQHGNGKLGSLSFDYFSSAPATFEITDCDSNCYADITQFDLFDCCEFEDSGLGSCQGNYRAVDIASLPTNGFYLMSIDAPAGLDDIPSYTCGCNESPSVALGTGEISLSGDWEFGLFNSPSDPFLPDTGGGCESVGGSEKTIISLETDGWFYIYAFDPVPSNVKVYYCSGDCLATFEWSETQPNTFAFYAPLPGNYFVHLDPI